MSDFYNIFIIKIAHKSVSTRRHFCHLACLAGTRWKRVRVIYTGPCERSQSCMSALSRARLTRVSRARLKRARVIQTGPRERSQSCMPALSHARLTRVSHQAPACYLVVFLQFQCLQLSCFSSIVNMIIAIPIDIK